MAGLLLLLLAAHVAVGWNAHGALSGLLRARDDAMELRALASNPSAYYGKTVTVRASIDLIVGGRALVLTERVMPHDHAVLAVMAADRALPGGLEEEEWVLVRGTVQRFDPTKWDLGTAAVEQALAGWAGGTAIIAESVTPVTS